MSNALAVSDIVNISISLSPIAAAVRNFGSLLIVGSSAIIDTTERIRSYASISAVAADFGTSAPEYLAAQNFFSQAPRPAQVYIGAWAYADTAGLLHGGALSASEQLLSAWTGITTGAFKITTDGVLRSLTTMDFSGATTMPGVAAIVNAKLGVNGACTWNAVYGRFEIVSPTTGTSSAVSYATSPSAGVDISAQLRLTAASNAVAPVAGIAAETLLTCVGILAANSNLWYGLNVASTHAVTADHLAVAGFIEAVSPSRIYGVTTQDGNAAVASATSDIAYQLKALNYSRTFVQYSSSNAYAAASLFGRAFTVDFTANNSTITLKFKNEPGIAAEALTETQAAALKGKNCNVFAAYNNGTAIIQEGVMCSGFFFDEIHGTDWLQNDMQTAVFNLLHDSPTKIPQTDAGVNTIATAITQSCERGIHNGLGAPGVWTGGNIGALVTGQTLTTGYYVYAPPIALQNSGDRAARIAPTIQVAFKFAGAVHFAAGIVNVNR